MAPVALKGGVDLTTAAQDMSTVLLQQQIQTNKYTCLPKKPLSVEQVHQYDPVLRSVVLVYAS